ncbi:SPOR domain-containing protein [Bacteroides sp. 519]|uniref:SPOR domain-containing protein n=1 Tax=Bacteroides sp. 519 TaxID=2302937 RepID=UPI0013D627CE|nr:SPOR domain-containing protein [Bacteroides sp. 519]NDV59231.1 SPOR domain-containing protein [Bacteroides sp. 519]
MKKVLVLGLSLCTIFAFTSCSSSESAYKKAYDKAVTDELAGTGTIPVDFAPVVTSTNDASVTTSTTTTTTPVVQPPAPSSDVKQEQVTYVSGNEALKAYSIVCGSFGLKENAEGLKRFLTSEGYNATIAFNADRAMYRVIVDSYNDKDSAARARDTFRAKYPSRSDFQNSWLLYRIY